MAEPGGTREVDLSDPAQTAAVDPDHLEWARFVVGGWPDAVETYYRGTGALPPDRCTLRLAVHLASRTAHLLFAQTDGPILAVSPVGAAAEAMLEAIGDGNVAAWANGQAWEPAISVRGMRAADGYRAEVDGRPAGDLLVGIAPT